MRARNLKPGFFVNELLIECDPLARILFCGLWCLADREGRLEDRPLKIKITILAGDNCEIEKLLDQLAQRGFIVRYEAEGLRCIQVVKFAEHQKPYCREQPSKLPPPPTSTSQCHSTDKVVSQHEKVSAKAATRQCHSSPDSGLLITDSGSLITDPSSLNTDSAAPQPSPPKAEHSTAPKEPKKTKTARKEREREPDPLFDAIAEITGSDPKASGSYIAKVRASLAKMEPPCSPEEVRSFPALLSKTMPYLSGGITLGTVEKYIGQVRRKPIIFEGKKNDQPTQHNAAHRFREDA